MNDTETNHNFGHAYHEFLLELFANFNRDKIEYCIPRNFESLPEKLLGDIDILIKEGHLKNAESTINELINNLIIIRRIKRNQHTQFFIISSAELMDSIRENHKASILELDFVTILQWNGVGYINTSEVLVNKQSQKKINIASKQHNAIHLLFHAILDKNKIKRIYGNKIKQAWMRHGPAIDQLLASRIGYKLTTRIHKHIADDDMNSLLSERNAIITNLVTHKPISIIFFLGFIINKYQRIFKAILFPPGVLVASAGPDGSGKTTLINKTGTTLNDAFNPVRFEYMGWKEFILPTKHILRLLQRISRKKNHDIINLSAGVPSPSWTHNVSVIHYFIDLWVRYIFRIRPALSRGGLVLCDRYFYDILVQNVWLCKNQWLRALLINLSPTPSVTIIFTGDPQAISKRKNENSTEETARQLSAFSILKKYKTNTLELDATSTLDKNVEDVVYAVIRQSGK